MILTKKKFVERFNPTDEYCLKNIDEVFRAFPKIPVTVDFIQKNYRKHVKSTFPYTILGRYINNIACEVYCPNETCPKDYYEGRKNPNCYKRMRTTDFLSKKVLTEVVNRFNAKFGIIILEDGREADTNKPMITIVSSCGHKAYLYEQEDSFTSATKWPCKPCQKRKEYEEIILRG